MLGGWSSAIAGTDARKFGCAAAYQAAKGVNYPGVDEVEVKGKYGEDEVVREGPPHAGLQRSRCSRGLQEIEGELVSFGGYTYNPRVDVVNHE